VEPTGAETETGLVAKLAAIGARPPTRTRRPTDYSRPGRPADLTTAAIDSLLDRAREEPTGKGDG